MLQVQIALKENKSCPYMHLPEENKEVRLKFCRNFLIKYCGLTTHQFQRLENLTEIIFLVERKPRIR